MIDIALEEALRKKKEHKSQSESTDWNLEKEEWIRTVHDLYFNIEKWLKEYQTRELLYFSYKEIDIEEVDIGKYTIKQMLIHLADEDITITPIGTMLIGAFGRVDINSKAKTIPLVLIHKDSDYFDDIKVDISVKGNGLTGSIVVGNSLIENISQDEKWKQLSWKVLLKDSKKPICIPLDEVSFIDIFKEMIGVA
jgi:hypothetical protein